MRKALFCTTNAWDSPFHVGSHHLAKGLASRGWDVGFVSDPISPFHALNGHKKEIQNRFLSYKSRGKRVYNDRIWAWVPGALFTPRNCLLFDSKFIQNNWNFWTLPDIISVVVEAGFGDVDLVYVDSLTQTSWWKNLRVARSMFRLADNPSGFSKFTPAAGESLLRLIPQVDLVACASSTLIPLAASLGAKRVLSLPNGVQYNHFAAPAPIPHEYSNERKPIVLYVGALDQWFDYRWIQYAAKALPEYCFVLIGPESSVRSKLGYLENVRILGVKPYAELPGYMQHANVGIIPFNVKEYGDLIHHVNPLKLYEYMSAGLPVISSRWDYLERIDSPIIFVDDAQSFAGALKKRNYPSKSVCQFFGLKNSWDDRVEIMLKALSFT